MEEKKIGKKLRDFIQCYDGDDLNSMRLAGYSGTDTYLRAKCKRFLEDVDVVEALKSRDTYIKSRQQMIATRQERQAFWTHLMRNEDPDARPEYDNNGVIKPTDNVPLSQRMKASELLGKSETDFVDRVQLEGQITITDIISDSYLLDKSTDVEDSIEAIEAQYKLLKESESEDVAVEEVLEEDGEVEDPEEIIFKELKEQDEAIAREDDVESETSFW